jgi:DNA-binding NarL/FixJ family response regulator
VIRVLLVDDQTLVRQGIRSLLEIAPDVEVVAEAEDGMTALAAVREHAPDVVLLDLRMPRHDGIWALEAMRESGIDTPALVLTTFDDDDLVLRALRAGARGYLLKDVTLEQLTGAVRTLADGGTLVQPSITDQLLRAVRSGAAEPEEDDRVPVQDLTERELEVLRLVAAGYSNREIAHGMFLAEGTVKNHVSSILDKLHAANRTQAARVAREQGFI